MRFIYPGLMFKVLRAWLELCLVVAQLYLRSPQWIGNYVNPKNQSTTSAKPTLDLTEADIQLARKWHEAVRLAGRLQLRQSTCLPKSVALTRLLSKRGLPAELHLGVRVLQGDLKSHAWVTLGAQMIGEPASVKQEFTEVNLNQWLQQDERG